MYTYIYTHTHTHIQREEKHRSGRKALLKKSHAHAYNVILVHTYTEDTQSPQSRRILLGKSSPALFSKTRTDDREGRTNRGLGIFSGVDTRATMISRRVVVSSLGKEKKKMVLF